MGARSSIISRSDGKFGQPVEPRSNRPTLKGETLMKKIMLAVALIVASAAPVMAEGFPNPYQTQR
jgi:hypothetical protein